VLPWCASHGAGFLPFSPLGRGFLTGALAGASFDAGDFRARNPRFTPDAMAANAALVEAVRAVAERRGVTPAQVALAWVLAQGEHVVPIPGTKKLAYLEQNAAAATVTLTSEDLAQLDALPAPVGARY
jgi:aryl-alcohol dehydrogenase-like predicted oxidoreductase